VSVPPCQFVTSPEWRWLARRTGYDTGHGKGDPAAAAGPTDPGPGGADDDEPEGVLAGGAAGRGPGAVRDGATTAGPGSPPRRRRPGSLGGRPARRGPVRLLPYHHPGRPARRAKTLPHQPGAEPHRPPLRRRRPAPH